VTHEGGSGQGGKCPKAGGKHKSDVTVRKKRVDEKGGRSPATKKEVLKVAWPSCRRGLMRVCRRRNRSMLYGRTLASGFPKEGNSGRGFPKKRGAERRRRKKSPSIDGKGTTLTLGKRVLRLEHNTFVL